MESLQSSVPDTEQAVGKRILSGVPVGSKEFENGTPPPSMGDRHMQDFYVDRLGRDFLRHSPAVLIRFITTMVSYRGVRQIMAS